MQMIKKLLIAINIRLSKNIFYLFFLFIIFSVAAQPEEDITGKAFYFENDVLALDALLDVNSDRNYTQGTAFAWFGAKFESNHWLLGSSRNFIDKKLNSHSNTQNVRKSHGFEIGVTAFTPDDLEQRDIIQGDRPYASLMYFTNSKISVDSERPDVAKKSAFTVGILGLQIARGFQRWLHDEIDSQDPLGWGNQISDGGELTFMYRSTRQNLLSSLSSPGKSDFSTSLEYSIGYYTEAAFGFDWRYGRVKSCYFQHDSFPLSVGSKKLKSVVPSNVSSTVAKTSQSDGESTSFENDLMNQMDNCGQKRKDSYFYAGYRYRFVGYNALLQGQFRNSAYELDDSEVRRLVHTATIGYSHDFSWPWKLNVRYSLSYRSQEFKGVEERDHFWGGIFIFCEY